MMTNERWDAARPKFGKLLHKENQYYFSKVDFIDKKKFTKVEKPFGLIADAYHLSVIDVVSVFNDGYFEYKNK